MINIVVPINKILKNILIAIVCLLQLFHFRDKQHILIILITIAFLLWLFPLHKQIIIFIISKAAGHLIVFIGPPGQE